MSNIIELVINGRTKYVSLYNMVSAEKIGDEYRVKLTNGEILKPQSIPALEPVAKQQRKRRTVKAVEPETKEEGDAQLGEL